MLKRKGISPDEAAALAERLAAQADANVAPFFRRGLLLISLALLTTPVTAWVLPGAIRSYGATLSIAALAIGALYLIASYGARLEGPTRREQAERLRAVSRNASTPPTRSSKP